MARGSLSGQNIKTGLRTAGDLVIVWLAFIIAGSIIITILRYAIRGQTKNVSWSDAVIVIVAQG